MKYISFEIYMDTYTSVMLILLLCCFCFQQHLVCFFFLGFGFCWGELYCGWYKVSYMVLVFVLCIAWKD